MNIFVRRKTRAQAREFAVNQNLVVEAVFVFDSMADEAATTKQMLSDGWQIAVVEQVWRTPQNAVQALSWRVFGRPKCFAVRFSRPRPALHTRLTRAEFVQMHRP